MKTNNIDNVDLYILGVNSNHQRKQENPCRLVHGFLTFIR